MNLLKRYKTIILLLIVVVLYLIIGIKVKTAVDISLGNETVTSKLESLEPIQKKDFNYELLLNYSDPFLNKGNEMIVKNNSSKIITQKKKIEVNSKLTSKINFPQLHLMGTVASLEKNKSLCIIKLDGKKEKILSKGDTISGISITEIYKDSIKIRIQNQYKIIKL